MFTIAILLLVVSGPAVWSEQDGAPRAIDETTLSHKVLCGYQGWFRCPGDPAGQGWRHWSRDATAITPANLTFDMWPETMELLDDERYEAPGFTTRDGRTANLFSSAHPRTVQRHFEWMREHDLDGVLLQRFLVNIDDPSFDRVLDHVRASAARTGRVYAIAYDLSGTPSDRLVESLTVDWKRLVDELGVTRDDRYLHHDGRPVLLVWGFFPDRFEAVLAHEIIDFLKADGPYRVTLVGGVPWWWRTVEEPEWSRAYRRFDVISPWNVGNVSVAEGKKYASTGYWKSDLAEARRAGMAYLPVFYPGFSWTNLKGEAALSQVIPRLGGEFFWRQIVIAADLGIEMGYVAMFDEVDEGTAIFKVSNDPPTPGRFATFEGLPSDWYLRLTGEGTRLLRGERRERAMPTP